MPFFLFRIQNLRSIFNPFFIVVKTDQKLTLFHLLNDVVQHSKRRNHQELLEKLKGILKESMPHLKDARICEKVMRCLNIWIERQVFEEKFVNDLTAIIDPGQNKADQDILDNFQVRLTNKSWVEPRLPQKKQV